MPPWYLGRIVVGGSSSYKTGSPAYSQGIGGSNPTPSGLYTWTLDLTKTGDGSLPGTVPIPPAGSCVVIATVSEIYTFPVYVHGVAGCGMTFVKALSIISGTRQSILWVGFGADGVGTSVDITQDANYAGDTMAESFWVQGATKIHSTSAYLLGKADAETSTPAYPPVGAYLYTFMQCHAPSTYQPNPVLTGSPTPTGDHFYAAGDFRGSRFWRPVNQVGPYTSTVTFNPADQTGYYDWSGMDLVLE